MENKGRLLSGSQGQMVRNDWISCMWQRAEKGQPPSWVDNVKREGSTQLEID